MPSDDRPLKGPDKKKPYVAPKFTVVNREQLEAQLKPKAASGDAKARKLLAWLKGREGEPES